MSKRLVRVRRVWIRPKWVIRYPKRVVARHRSQAAAPDQAVASDEMENEHAIDVPPTTPVVASDRPLALFGEENPYLAFLQTLPERLSFLPTEFPPGDSDTEFSAIEAQSESAEEDASEAEQCRSDGAPQGDFLTETARQRLIKAIRYRNQYGLYSWQCRPTSAVRQCRFGAMPGEKDRHLSRIQLSTMLYQLHQAHDAAPISLEHEAQRSEGKCHPSFVWPLALWLNQPDSGAKIVLLDPELGVQLLTSDASPLQHGLFDSSELLLLINQ